MLLAVVQMHDVIVLKMISKEPTATQLSFCLDFVIIVQLPAVVVNPLCCLRCLSLHLS